MIKKGNHMNRRMAVLAFITACLASVLLADCTSTHQTEIVATGPIATNTTRIVVSRGTDGYFQCTAPIIIVDNGKQIGDLGPGGQIVWDRIAGPMELTAFKDSFGKGQPAILHLTVCGGMSYKFRVSMFGDPNFLSLVSRTPVTCKQNVTNTRAGKVEIVQKPSI